MERADSYPVKTKLRHTREENRDSIFNEIPGS